jgi:hypothetical protein
LSGGFGDKHLITQIYIPNLYFATHFQTNITYQNPCNSNWNNDKWIDSSFWALNPSSQNIICAIYGSSTDTGTAYTKLWDNYVSNDCISANMTVSYVSSVSSINANTIYVLQSGNYNVGNLGM